MRLKAEDKACLVEESRMKAEQEEQARLKAEYEAHHIKDTRQETKEREHAKLKIEEGILFLRQDLSLGTFPCILCHA